MIYGRDCLQRHHLASCAQDLTTRSRVTPPSPTSPNNGSYLGVVGANFLQDKCEYRLAKGFNECRFVDATARLV
ncbi:hypothetical protein ALC57_10892 [Trachymyrmex cornetzi]|uniref:Uncharacterized protein n=1 Tax=Trachymyrmex cornetzi TaxID=471704 RepID=A0A151J332_9HYME|nr:hypothetical protein ALC57_10892 [Trachymyrmex cornetzi]